ncbi:unnamed protein product [Soboliphyme baturini]|uniref:Mpv17-like protein 2 n=1 Tax=Soboliphyme baturini TaxID=241478 RepID=A0A183J3P6_9BILA|nr:unnamed protein product [Soboliphyme baturini]
MTKILRKLTEVHKVLFGRNCLLATNICICISLTATGDVVQQQTKLLRGISQRYDTRRTFNMSMSAISFGVICHYWYCWLDKFLPGYSLATVLKKVFLDQVFLSPFMWVTYFATLGVVEQSDWQRFLCRCLTSGSQLYKAEWIVWPPAQIFNFYFLSTKYRVLYDSFVSFGFDWYSSYLLNDQNNDD